MRRPARPKRGDPEGESPECCGAEAGLANADVDRLRGAWRLRSASRRRLLTLAGALGTAAVVASPAQARAVDGDSQNDARDEPAAGADRERPFVEHRLALQLSDRDEDKQAMILSVSYNLLKAYGPDLIAIEVVAFGPGIDLLRAGSVHRPKVDSLVAQAVRFDVCMNTVETIERNTGQTVDLNPNARKVQAGVARILTLCESGYVLVRP